MNLNNMNTINWDEFEKVELRVGTVIEVLDFLEARNPAYKIKVDFGEELGIKRSSAQITKLYTKEELVGKQIIGVLNFSPKQIGPFISEFLITGFVQGDGEVVLAVPDKKSKDGCKLV